MSEKQDIFVEYKKFFAAYHSLLLFTWDFEKNWMLEQRHPSGEPSDKRKEYCKKILAKNKKRLKDFQDIFFDLPNREFEIGYKWLIKINNTEEMETVFCGNVADEIEKAEITEKYIIIG